MNESIIPGIVIGVIVAVAVGCVSHVLRKREMQDLWAEEERRRKSDRRRELYERDLGVVTHSLYGITEATTAWGKQAEERIWLIAEAYRMIFKSLLVAGSLNDSELTERLGQVVGHFTGWVDFRDTDTGKAKEGKEKEAAELAAQTKSAASAVLRRIREILEEV